MARKTIEKNISYDADTGKYYVNFNYGKNEKTGERVKELKTYPDLKQARKALKEFNSNKIKGTVKTPTDQTLSEWIDEWYESKELNCEKTTVYGYRNIINNHIKPALGHIKLQKVTTSMINTYLLSLKKEKGLSNSTIRKHYDLLHDVFAEAFKQDIIAKNPLTNITPTKKQKRKLPIYNIAQLKQLFKLIKGDRLEIAVKLASTHSLRRGEVCGLRWRAVDMDGRIISIEETRTQAGKELITKGPKSQKSNRLLYITDALYNALLQVKAKQAENKKILGDAYDKRDFIFCWEDGQPFRPNYLSDMFKAFLKKNNLPHIRFHALRSSFASVGAHVNASERQISDASGDNLNTIDEIYVQTLDAGYKDALNAVSNALEADDDE
jgi:integrase